MTTTLTEPADHAEFVARTVVACHCALIALFLTLVSALCRTGFGIDLHRLIDILGLSLFLLLLPDSFLYWKRHQTAWYSSDAAILLYGILMVILGGTIQGQGGLRILPGFVIAGFLFLFVQLYRYLRYCSRSALSLVFVFFLGIWMAGTLWTFEHELSPLFLEGLVFGWGHPDTAFHASLSSMMSTYSMASTGLDGIPHVAYHFGSHWVFAQFSKILNVNSLYFYNVAYLIICPPLLLKSCLTFILDVRKSLRLSMIGLEGGLFWFIFSAAFIGFIPFTLLNDMTNVSSYLFLSESYGFAFGLTFLVGSLLIYFITSRSSNARWTLSSYLFVLIVLPLLVGAIGISKISSAIVFSGVGCYLFYRCRLGRRTIYWISGFLCLGAAGLAYFKCKDFEATHFALKISPLHFLRWHVEDDVRPFFPLIYYCWSNLYIYFRLREEKIQTWQDLKHKIQDGTFLDVEAVFIIAWLGFIPGALLYIYGGSALFFSNIQNWVSLAMFLALLPRFYSLMPRVWPTGQSLRPWMIMFLCLPFIWSYADNIFCSCKEFVAQNYDLRMAVVNMNEPAVSSEETNTGVFAPWVSPITKMIYRLRHLRSGAPGSAGQDPHSALLSNSRYQLLARLSSLGEQEPSVRKKTALFIPKSNNLYWDIPGRCEKNAFLAPSLSGSAMIDGLPPVDCQRVGRGTYAYPAGRPPLNASDEAGLCRRAAEQSASQIIILEEKSGNLKETDLHC